MCLINYSYHKILFCMKNIFYSIINQIIVSICNILNFCGWIFVGIVYGLLMRSCCCSFLFMLLFLRIFITIYGIIVESGFRFNIMAWIDSSMMCRSGMSWRIGGGSRRFDTWSFSSVLAPTFTLIFVKHLSLLDLYSEI